MSWYNYKEWRNAIRKQRETNTPRAFIRGITKYVASKSLHHHRSRGTRAESRQEIILNVLFWFLSHSDFANLDVYKQVRDMALSIDDYNGDNDYVKKLEESVCTCMPYWFASALINKKVPMPKRESFENMSYYIDNYVLEDFVEYLPVVNIPRLLEYSPIENKDTFHKLFITRTKDEIPDLLSRMNATNMLHIDIDFINEIRTIYAYDSFEELIREMTNPVNIFKCSVAPLYIIKNGINILQNTSKNIILRSASHNPILTTNDFINICNILDVSIYDSTFQTLTIYNSKVMYDLIRNGHILDPSTKVMSHVSESNSIAIEDVLDMRHLDWDWENLSHNPNIATPENIEKYPNLPWVWGRWGISSSPSLTEEFIEKNFDLLNKSIYPYDGGSLLHNPCLTTNIVDSHPEIDWDYTHRGLSKNTNVTLPYFIKNINQNWELHALVESVSLCEDIAVRAIQACWRIYKTHQKAKWLAEQVVEWSYHPDCKPAMNIRKRKFEENLDSLFV